jgi:hypothetical protein
MFIATAETQTTFLLFFSGAAGETQPIVKCPAPRR